MRAIREDSSCVVAELANHLTLEKNVKGFRVLAKLQINYSTPFIVLRDGREILCSQQFLPKDCYINRSFILSALLHRLEGHCRVESTYKPLGQNKKCHTDTSFPAPCLQNNSPSVGFLNKLQICYPPKM